MYILDNQSNKYLKKIFICNNLKIKSMEICKILSDFFSAKFVKALQNEI